MFQRQTQVMEGHSLEYTFDIGKKKKKPHKQKNTSEFFLKKGKKYKTIFLLLTGFF